MTFDAHLRAAPFDPNLSAAVDALTVAIEAGADDIRLRMARDLILGAQGVGAAGADPFPSPPPEEPATLLDNEDDGIDVTEVGHLFLPQPDARGVVGFVVAGCQTDGAHHKQWFLEGMLPILLGKFAPLELDTDVENLDSLPWKIGEAKAILGVGGWWEDGIAP